MSYVMDPAAIERGRLLDKVERWRDKGVLSNEECALAYAVILVNTADDMTPEEREQLSRRGLEIAERLGLIPRGTNDP